MKDTMSDAIPKDREEKTLEGDSETCWRLPHRPLQRIDKCMESIGIGFVENAVCLPAGLC